MSGGTFAAEAQVLFADLADGHVTRTSRRPGRSGSTTRTCQRKNTVIDLGADEFTVGRPHPMIDYSIRKKRIAAEAADPETAVILLDVVLGYGSHPDPSAELADVISDASDKVIVICSVTGTDAGPAEQERGRGGAHGGGRRGHAQQRRGLQGSRQWRRSSRSGRWEVAD